MKKTDLLIKKMNELMIRQRSPYIEQYVDQNQNVKWHQRDASITDNALRDHFEAKRTLGIFYARGGTPFLFFDVDAKGDPVGQEVRVKGIMTALLKAGILQENIHVMFSGNKGYHVQLFFDNLLPINSVAAFGRVIIDKLNHYRSGVELRPESTKGRGVKLPLALHQATGAFATYVDPYMLEMVEDSEDYFLNIQPMPTEQMRAAINLTLEEEKLNRAEPQPLESTNTRLERAKREFADMPIPTGQSSGLREKAEKLLRDGLQEIGTRHDSQFLLALHFKGLGFPLESAINEVSDWMESQRDRGMTNEDGLDYLLSEVKRHVTLVYDNTAYVGLYDNRGRPPEMTSEDAIRRIPKEKPSPCPLGRSNDRSDVPKRRLLRR
ncbi:TOTE conflict system archaeo-eukaryotic primase domain-containing protein [Tumebacillus permanentifrigoris]|uniref:TOTE conflict system primase domain-containing protein n=1 Tax=Tumebacillus permanentifrigoris TaxID=378543 RepID=A0A316D636_9BACL|nr:hypothetical protein [Tumebacillus permanentifrigoris]PWK07048.1 hypothetical protein C7459_118124 [Tumebacillus permanentifrigoris]